jgi:outer membrane protein assembly factor BamB
MPACRLAVAAFIIAWLGATVSAQQAPATGHWPQFRGPNRDGISGEKDLLRQWPPEGPMLLWKATGIGEGFSSVSIVDGRIHTQGYAGGKEWVTTLEEATGRQLWRVALGPAERVAYPGSRSTPTADGAFLYVETVAGDVACLEAKTGNVVWRKHLKQDFKGRPGVWGYSESPLVDGERVIVTPGGEEASLVALNKRDGSVLWQASVPKGDREYPPHKRDPYTAPGVAAYASPIVAEVKGVRHYVQFLQQGLVGFGADDGKVLWQDASSANDLANCATPIFSDGRIFSAAGWKGSSLVQLEAQGGSVAVRPVYAVKTLKNQYGGFVLVNGCVYGCSDGVLTCMDFLTGKVNWENRSVGMGPVMVADGMLYVRGDGGITALVEPTPAEYRERGRFTQPDRSKRPCRAYPVVAGGRLYLRDDDVLLCYNVKGPEADQKE